MKKLLLIFLTLTIAGAALTVLGAATGADETIKWTRDGFVSAAKSISEIKELPVEPGSDLPFRKLSVSAGSADVEIISSRELPAGYAIENVHEGQYTVELKDGELIIDVRNAEGVALFPLSDLLGEHRVKVTVTGYFGDTILSSLNVAVASGSLLVKGVDTEEMNLSVASGQIGFQQGMCFKNAALSCASGNINLDNLSAERLRLSVGSGRITATDLETKGLTAEVTSGRMDIDGKMLGETGIKVGSGDATLAFDLPMGEYRRDLTVGSGEVFINGEPMKGNDTNSAAKNGLTASVGSGTLRVDFAK